MPMTDPQPRLRGEGRECYDWCHYLWHLIAVRALAATTSQAMDPAEGKYDVAPDAWALLPDHENTPPGAGVVVALIDTGVSDRHPNLAGRVLETVDFAAHPYGVRYLDPLTDAPLTVNAGDPSPLAKREVVQIRGLQRRRADSFVSDAVWTAADGAVAGAAGKAALARLRAGRGVEQRLGPAVRLRYAAHGTACAGLIAGAPAAAPAPSPAPAPGTVDPITGAAPVVCPPDEDAGAGALPYWGVAPGAVILPIVVSAEPTAEQLILAFLYALSWRGENDERVSVIHFPREAPHPDLSPDNGVPYGDTRYDADAAGAPATPPAWDVCRQVLLHVAAQVPVVCAAGNDGLDALSWPAAEADGGNGVIAVGAATYLARRSSYSNYAAAAPAQTLTIAAPSDDAEVYARTQIRLDRESPDWRRHNHYLHALERPETVAPYAPQALLATDVPGPDGYAAGVAAESSAAYGGAERGGLYALFGGTSGASAIVAGAVALLQAKQAPGPLLTGPQAAAKLAASGQTNVAWPWLTPSPQPLRPDGINGEDAANPALAQRQFGAGVLDLTKLLA